MAKQSLQNCSECASFILRNYEACPIIKDKQGDPWVYPTGICKNKQSIHAGRTKLPGWKICYMYIPSSGHRPAVPLNVPAHQQKSIYDV